MRVWMPEADVAMATLTLEDVCKVYDNGVEAVTDLSTAR